MQVPRAAKVAKNTSDHNEVVTDILLSMLKMSSHKQQTLLAGINAHGLYVSSNKKVQRLSSSFALASGPAPLGHTSTTTPCRPGRWAGLCAGWSCRGPPGCFDFARYLPTLGTLSQCRHKALSLAHNSRCPAQYPAARCCL